MSPRVSALKMPLTYAEYAEARQRTNNPLKLTEDMSALLQLLRAGWTLRSSTTMRTHAWATHPDGHRHTGVRSGTVNALTARRLLAYKYAFPTATYQLTAFGKMVAADGGVAPIAKK